MCLEPLGQQRRHIGKQHFAGNHPQQEGPFLFTLAKLQCDEFLIKAPHVLLFSSPITPFKSFFFLLWPLGYVEFKGQLSDLSHICHLCCSCANAGSLTHSCGQGSNLCPSAPETPMILLMPQGELPPFKSFNYVRCGLTCQFFL